MPNDKDRLITRFSTKENDFLRLKRIKLSAHDFSLIRIIGQGAFGQVKLVQKNDSGKVYAMKSMKKTDMFKQNQLAHVKAERDILAASSKTNWVV